MPNKEKKIIKAARYPCISKITIITNAYLLESWAKRGKKYSIIGIGEITSLEDDYIHITCETSLEEITKSQKN